MSHWLCLHGWGGSKSDFEMGKLGGLSGRKTFAQSRFGVPFADFSSFLASLGHPAELIDALRDMPHMTWVDDALGSPLDTVLPLPGGEFQVRVPLLPWQRALDDLAALWTSDGPFTGVAGFSQGGWLAILLLAAARQLPERYACFASLRTAIVIAVPDRRIAGSASSADAPSAAASADAAAAAAEAALVLRSDEKLAVRTIVLRGTRDPLLKPLDGVQYAPLLSLFCDATVREYAGAHQVPFDRALWTELSSAAE
jgi:pimeloyl-ACP methyl ester carboxylesterase